MSVPLRDPRGHRWPLRAYLILFGLWLIAPALLFSAYLLVQFTAGERARLELRADDNSRRLSLALDRDFEGMIRTLQVLAAAPSLERGDLAVFHQHARRTHAHNVASIALHDAGGRQVLSTSFGGDAQPPAQALPAMRRMGLADVEAMLSDLLVDAEGGRAFMIGLRLVQGTYAGGTLSMTVQAERLRALVAAQRAYAKELRTEWHAEITDRAERIVARTENPELVGTALPALVARASDRHSGIHRYTDGDGMSYLRGWHQSRMSGWTSAVWVPASTIEEQIWPIWRQLAAAGATLLGLSLLLAWLVSRHLEQPIRALARAADDLAQGRRIELDASNVLEADKAASALMAASEQLRQSSERLQASEERKRLALEIGQVGSGEWDLAADRIVLDPVACRIFGTAGTADGITAEAFYALVHADDREPLRRSIERVIDSQREGASEFRLVRGDGEERWVSAGGRAVYDCAGRPLRLVGVVQDVTEQKRAQQVLAQSKGELEVRVAERTRELNELNERLKAEMGRREAAQASLVQAQKLEVLGQLTSGVAHDFNNILQAVKSNLELLERRVTDPELMEHVRSGARAVRRAAGLISQLQSFRLRHSRAPVAIDLGAALTEFADVVRNATGHRLELDLDVPPHAWRVLADPDRLQSALLNIAINARDAMPAGGRLAVSVRHLPATAPGRPHGLPAGDFVVIDLEDSGGGMSEEVLARAREPFFTTKPRGEGSGLGLAMVQGFVDQSGGLMLIASRPGEGTIVELFLPRTELPVPSMAEAGRSVTLPAASATLLYVDDDDEARSVTAKLLREIGHVVFEAKDAETGLEMIEDGVVRPDVVVTDVVMPGMDGIAFAARLGGLAPGLPVLFVTADAKAEAPAGPLLRKPFAHAELASAIHQLLPARSG